VSAARIIGVLGAGTMGAGIAQLAARSGAETLLFDPVPEALQRGLGLARQGLEKEAARGRITAEQAASANAGLRGVESLDALASCDLVIEAVPERLELKHELFGALSEIVSPSCVLASNTSSLLVTAIAAAASHPERVVGMHFFNPAPIMRLLEIVAGEQSTQEALTVAQSTGEAMGKSVIRAHDGPGFLVNRCNRPFGLEALRLLSERIADIETVDRIVRMEGGFRMGPFELMDLVGVDTGLEISKSFYEQSFGEPRWRPSPISVRYVAAGLHGRKTGRGYYDYTDGAHRPDDPEPPAPQTSAQGQGLVMITGPGALAEELRQAAQAAGYEVHSRQASSDELPALVIDCGDTDEEPGPRRGARLVLCDRGSLAALDPGGSAIGFHVLGPLTQAGLVELTRQESSSPLAIERAERFFTLLGKHVARVGDAPGLVLGRIVCQLINESAFSLGEGVGSAQDIDTGMVLGLNHPRGPLEWADEIGLDRVLGTLQALSDEYREERYRPAPALRALVAAGKLGRATGAGFFEYEA
jgi:3-hydroxybutyryl-CoA dehydrogenase